MKLPQAKLDQYVWEVDWIKANRHLWPDRGCVNLTIWLIWKRYCRNELISIIKQKRPKWLRKSK